MFTKVELYHELTDQERDFTLDDFVALLPECHRARKELKVMKEEIERLKRIEDKIKEK